MRLAKKLYKGYIYSIENKTTKEKQYGRYYEWEDKLKAISLTVGKIKDIEKNGIRGYRFKIEEVIELPKDKLQRNFNRIYSEFIEHNI